MSAPESALLLARLAALAPTERRFRINAGWGWVGDVLRVRSPRSVALRPGDVLIRHARVFHAAPADWPDLCGWDVVTITPEMVGTTVAVFVGEEAKTGRGRLSAGQARFRECLQRMGGRYLVLRG